MSTTADRLEKGSRNNSWISENQQKLREEYGGEFIAVEDGEVIAHSPRQDDIIEEMNDKADDPASAIITYIYESGMKILR